MNKGHIGLLIKHYRQVAGLTQKQLAGKIGVTWEMVSRYETGKSSAMMKILAISDALGISPSLLLSDEMMRDTDTTYKSNAIPMLVDLFTNIDVALKKTKSFYSAPDWIIQQTVRPFAVDTAIVTSETSRVAGAGILYISKEKPSSSQSLTLIIHDKKLKVLPFGNRTSTQKILGTVVAYEIRFE